MRDDRPSGDEDRPLAAELDVRYCAAVNAHESTFVEMAAARHVAPGRNRREVVHHAVMRHERLRADYDMAAYRGVAANHGHRTDYASLSDADVAPDDGRRMHKRMELAASRGDSLCIRAARGRIAFIFLKR